MPVRPMKAASASSIIVGIDPGAGGGLCILETSTLSHIHMTKVSMLGPIPDTRLGLQLIVDKIVSDFGSAVVYFEHVWNRPTDGGSSAFKFGKSVGSLEQAFCKMRTEFVVPQKWQKGLGIAARNSKGGESKPQHKDRLRVKSQQLFPGLDMWSENVTLQRKVCDALLIAEYGRRRELGLIK